MKDAKLLSRWNALSTETRNGAKESRPSSYVKLNNNF